MDKDDLLAERSAKKEGERAKMIAFMQAEMQADKYVWDRKLWADVTAKGDGSAVFLVSDARRPNDVDFLR